MSMIETANVIEIKVIPYDVTKVQTIDATMPYSPYNYSNIVDNCKEIKETLLLMIQDDIKKNIPIPERISDIGITSSWFCAIDCLAVGLYDPSVLFASISVECVLNHDMRLESYRRAQPYEWIDLNWQNLKYAHENGLPTDLLLNADEVFDKNINIEFVIRRNKVAHGDMEGYRALYPGTFDKSNFDSNNFNVGYSKPSKQHALSQIDKAKHFIIEWANQKPRIRLH